jgi:hypothetical protein
MSEISKSKIFTKKKILSHRIPMWNMKAHITIHSKLGPGLKFILWIKTKNHKASKSSISKKVVKVCAKILGINFELHKKGLKCDIPSNTCVVMEHWSGTFTDLIPRSEATDLVLHKERPSGDESPH